MNLILLEPHEAQTPEDVALGGDRAAHLRGVLRVVPGQTVRLGIVDGPIGDGTVTSIDGDAVHLRCAFGAVPPRPRIDLLLAVPRPKVMRRLWAQLAAVGVGRIILTNASRVERPYFDTHVLTPECYRPLLVEGLQQARDTHLPEVSIHRQFRVLVEDQLDSMIGDGTRVVAEPGAASPLETVVERRRPDRLVLAIGPEGGWNTFELQLLQSHGFEAAAMGPRTLRTDTACIAALAVAYAALR